MSFTRAGPTSAPATNAISAISLVGSLVGGAVAAGGVVKALVDALPGKKFLDLRLARIAVATCPVRNRMLREAKPEMDHCGRCSGC